MPSVPAPQCSDADVNIVFTSEELARLKTLERRFFTIAESIRTDEDIAREISNHDTFELKGTQILELYNICIQKSDRLTNPIYKRRVRTPFWNTTTDAPGFVTNEPGAGIDIFNTTPPNPLNSNNTPTYKRILERLLRLNLW